MRNLFSFKCFVYIEFFNVVLICHQCGFWYDISKIN